MRHNTFNTNNPSFPERDKLRETGALLRPMTNYVLASFLFLGKWWPFRVHLFGSALTGRLPVSDVELLLARFWYCLVYFDFSRVGFDSLYI